MSAQEWLDRADALTAAAAEGPWKPRRLPKSAPTGQYVMTPRGTSVCHVGTIYYDGHDDKVKADAEFIAASRALLPQAVAAIRAGVERCLLIEEDSEVAQRHAAESNDGRYLMVEQSRQGTAREIRTVLERALKAEPR